MQGIPKTYKFKKCDNFTTFCDIMKNNNAELFKYINGFHNYEFNSGEMLLIYKNNILIGYLCIAPVNNVISLLNQYLNVITKTNSLQNIPNKDKKLFLHSIHKTNEYLMLFNNIILLLKSNNILDIALLEIIQDYRSLNTIKVIFNYLKQYCINNNFEFAWCRAKNKIVGRLYLMAGFKYIGSNKDNLLDMFLKINDIQYYEVTEKLKNKYKKNLFRTDMKDTKKLYETIMASVAKQVKKAINEGEYRNDYSSREDYEDEGLDVQGDIEAWIDGIKYFLNDNISSEHTLPVLATVIGWNELHNEELRGLAESIMGYAEKYGDVELPLFDEVFIDPITSELFDNGIIDDWMADVVNENKIDAYDI